MAFEFKGGDQPAATDHDDVPKLRRSEVTWKGHQGTFEVNAGMGEAVGADDIAHKSDEAVHVLSGRNTGALALISLSRFDLLLPGPLAVAPKMPGRLRGLCLHSSQGRSARHLFLSAIGAVAAKRGAFIGIETIEFENSLIAGFDVTGLRGGDQVVHGVAGYG